MKFIGRVKELSKIQSLISSKEMKTCLLYGRRRVGKSELIKKALSISQSKNIYYICKQTTEENNVECISQLISDTMELPKLGFKTIEETLEYLFQLSIKDKLVLVLDEYPYLRNNVKGLDSILQSLIDKYRSSSSLTLIILGSYIDVMKSLLEEENPLYGRMDSVIKLSPMNYYDSSLFYPNFSFEDKVRIYSVFGGIPYYNRLIDDTKSVKENIIELIASPDARLENEVSMYLESEMNKIVNANETFETLAKGYSKYNDILSQSHVSSGPTLVDVLNKLINMEIVDKIVPINDEYNKRKTGYRICDNFSLFYYKYIFRYASQLKIMNPDIFYDTFISKDFEEKFIPMQFEDIAKQYLIHLNQEGKMNPPFFKIGKYYYDDQKNHRNGEFDIVTEDENGYVFYEVKFQKHILSKSEIEKEINQVLLTGFNCYKFLFITRNGVDKINDKRVDNILLEDLYQIRN